MASKYSFVIMALCVAQVSKKIRT